MRAFEYRFSKRYLDGLQGAQRPVEREIFGERPSLIKTAMTPE